MVTPNLAIMPGIIQKALTIEKRLDLYTKQKELTVSEEAKIGAREIGLDLEKLTMTKSARERLRPKDLTAQTIRDILFGARRAET